MTTTHGFHCDINKQGIATLTLDRPECHNAFNAQLIRDLTHSFSELDANPSVRAVILQGKGKCFSAGADLHWMQDSRDFSLEDNLNDALELAELMKRLDNLSKPSIAVVNGAAFGGALGLIACCDIAIATDKAKFCFSEVKLGLVPAVISPYILRAIGIRQARRFVLTAETFNAQQAHAMSFIHELVAPEDIDQTLDHYCQQIIKNGPEALLASKQLLQKVAFRQLDEDIFRETAMLIAKVRVSDEAQAGLAAFFAKQTPYWIHHETD